MVEINKSHASAEDASGEHSTSTLANELELAHMLGSRDDFIIDLRDGRRTRSYLRSAVEPCQVPAARAPLRRMFDLASALLALVILSPIFLLVTVVSRLTTAGSVFYAQERVGRHGQTFRCLKFRSMYPDADERLKHLLMTDAAFRAQWLRDHKAENDPRITPLGRWLRVTSLDELPQLINVVRGEMSIIGPRPVVPEETIRYGEAMSMVLSVRPGLTGLWQASGRNSLSYEERVALDIRYVRERSLLLDAKILAKTALCVLTGQGAG